MVITTGADIGRRFLVLDETALGFIERGRPPTQEERAEAKPPFESRYVTVA